MIESKAPENPYSHSCVEVDVLIIGQGICGTMLSYELLNAGQRVRVIDDDRAFTASKVASGIINPVTGRRMVRTWMIEILLPFAIQQYDLLGKQLGVPLYKNCSVIDFHPSLQMQDAFNKRLDEEKEYLHTVDDSEWKKLFNFHFGAGRISPCLLIDIHALLSGWRRVLQEQALLVPEPFEINSLTLTGNNIRYQNIIADKIIFCDGVDGISNPFFRNLPYAPNKGEVIVARIPGLEREHIYKQGLSIVPWKQDLFWIGSSYEWNFTDVLPTAGFKNKVAAFLSYFLKIPFEIVDHIASVRPANLERRPFAGMHPTLKSVGILNGMGTKGCSLAPFFARQLAMLLVEGEPIVPAGDISRFEKILARKMN